MALFALAVQLALSFGHVHLDNFARVAGAGFGKILLSEPVPSHDSSGSVDTDCPICAMVQLIASSAPGAAPTLPPPPDYRSIRPQAVAALAWAAAPRALFQARGPPA